MPMRNYNYLYSTANAPRGEEDAMTTYRCVGDIRGDCGHEHKTIAGAARCLARDEAECAGQGGYSDRELVDSDGHEYLEVEMSTGTGWVVADIDPFV